MGHSLVGSIAGFSELRTCIATTYSDTSMLKDSKMGYFMSIESTKKCLNRYLRVLL